MFSGIIEATAQIQKKTDDQLVIARPASFDVLTIGASIAVSGVCLSVVAYDDETMTFDVVAETWAKTKLGSLNIGDCVNLERSVQADQRLDGHIVQGHVEGVGKVLALSPSPSPASGEGSSGQKVIRRLNRFRYPPRSVVSHAKDMRTAPTEAEEKLWNLVRSRAIDGLYFRRQRPVGRFIIDFYCEQLRLGIELDGSVHHSDEEQEYDRCRDEELEARGVHILRFSNEVALKSPQMIVSAIRNAAKNIPPPPLGGGARGGGATLTIKLPQELIKFCVQKGSIALDGVSLTIASVQGNQIEVALVPHTLEHTTLGSLKNGDPVNIETDVVGRYVFAFTKDHAAV